MEGKYSKVVELFPPKAGDVRDTNGARERYCPGRTGKTNPHWQRTENDFKHRSGMCDVCYWSAGGF